MGASHATLTSTKMAEYDSEQQDSDRMAHFLEHEGFALEQRLYPGSGRMMKSFRIKHMSSDALVVTKTMWVSKEHEKEAEQQQDELTRIREALEGQAHVAPFDWYIGDYNGSTSISIRPIYLLRPHFYATLSDRLASRPFLSHLEKCWIVHQLLDALQAMHDAGVVHGFVTTENVCLTSWNWLVLTDVSSYKYRTALVDDDPSEYLYYFQELDKDGTDTTPREKRCYLAPERFYTPTLRDEQQQHTSAPLSLQDAKSASSSAASLSAAAVSSSPSAPSSCSSVKHEQIKMMLPSMDIFSAGCVVMETFLNGERALDLGDLMEYRRRGTLTASMQQRLSKIESSSLRAACRHMLHLNPNQRLSAKEYRDRLQEDVIPKSTFDDIMKPLFERITCREVTADARMAVAATYYGKVLKGTVGVVDTEGEAYFAKVLGPTMSRLEAGDAPVGGKIETTTTTAKALSDIGNRLSAEDSLMAETEALLKKLESPSFDDEDDDDDEPLSLTTILPRKLSPEKHGLAPPSRVAAASLLIYLQLILSTVRSVQRPSSKLVGLQLLERLGSLSADDSKLQRIVPVTISMLHDQDPLVRASAVQVLASTLSTIKTFAPSDSKIFPQYIFKRVGHLSSDPSLVVRIAFARCIASLADTAHRFLDISHAVLLYEAVGGGNSDDSGAEVRGAGEGGLSPGVFTDEVTSLLDGKQGEEKSIETGEGPSHSRKSSIGNAPATTSTVGRTLISSTYVSELAALHEIVSRWVVHITTDQSDQSSPPKRSLLCDLARLCNFFGRDGVMAFILPQILAFLNDRRDWQLRSALFERLQSVCSIIGRAATEHFVLPCLETALVDAQDLVMSQALTCLSSLVDMGLLSRSILVAPQSVLPTTGIPCKPRRGLFEKYLPLLVFPCSNVRQSAVTFVTASCRSLGFPDAFVFLLPLLRPYLRFEPSSNHLTSHDGLERCLIAPWTRSKLNRELARIAEAGSRHANLDARWTPVECKLEEGDESKQESIDDSKQNLPSPSIGVSRVMNSCMVDYLTMLQRSRRANASGNERLIDGSSPAMMIDGSLKLAQHVRFPHQCAAGTEDVCIPSWYNSIRDASDMDQQSSEVSAIRSVVSLSQVYGLSVIEDPTLADSRVSKDTVIVDSETIQMDERIGQDFDNDSVLHSEAAIILRGANAGEWGSDVRVDPINADAALLVTKMKGLEVPPLPPNLGLAYKHDSPTMTLRRDAGGDSRIAGAWKPKTDTLIASSSAMNGHTGPVSRLAVSPDERYFVSASYDGTLRVWETRQAEDSDGYLASSTTYSGHCSEQSHPRINDVAALENSESVVSGASDGSLHVWRVDKVSPTSAAVGASQNISRDYSSRYKEYDRSRVSGCTIVRKINPEEGEIHAVSHFNTASASVVVFATQCQVHSIDLRQSREPFYLKHQPETGYLTSMAMGDDSQWMVTGTSRGFVALWDLRFQQMVKLWQHSSQCPVTRLGTSFASSPKKWGDRTAPVILVACGQNECGMYDAMSGSCRECFRVIGPRTGTMDSFPDQDRHSSVPVLRQIDLAAQRKVPKLCDFSQYPPHVSTPGPSINALIGNAGGSECSSLVTGGDDGYIRYWDFAAPSKCFTVSGSQGLHHRPTFERVDHDGQRLMLCRQAPAPRHTDVESSRFPRMLERGPFRAESRHTDSVLDVKSLSFPENLILSCSRDFTVKMWR